MEIPFDTVLELAGKMGIQVDTLLGKSGNVGIPLNTLSENVGKMGAPFDALLDMVVDGMLALFENDAVLENKVEALKLTMIRRVLGEDIEKEDYTRIQKLFEGGHISNEKLVDMVDKPRAMTVGFKEIIFMDIKVLLSNEIIANPALSELFVTVYSKKYSKGYRIAKQGIKNGKDSIKSQADALEYAERAFCLYVILINEDASDESCLNSELFRQWKLEVSTEGSFMSDDYTHIMGNYKQFTFSETGESIFFQNSLKCFFLSRKVK